MRRFTAEVTDLFARQHAVASREQLLRAGLTARQVEHLIASGVAVIVHPAVYRLAGAPATDLSNYIAVCLCRDYVVLSHQTAGRFHGLRRLGPDRRVHVTIPGAERAELGDTVVHRCFALDEADVWTRPDGIRLATVERTIFDLAATRPAEAIESMIEQALHEGWTTLGRLRSVGERLRKKGRTGSARFNEVLSSRGQDPAVASDLERRFDRAVRDAGLPIPLRQSPVELPSGITIHPDFYWPNHRLVVEIDHIAWHGGRADRARDSNRDRAYRRLGLTVLRFNDAEITCRLTEVVVDVAGALRTAEVHPHRT